MMVLRDSAGSADLHLSGQTLFPGLELGDFLPGQLRQFALGRFGLQKGGVLRQIIQHFEIALAGIGQLLEPRVFARSLLRFERILKELGIVQGGFDLTQAAGEFFDVGAEIHIRAARQKAIRPPKPELARAGRRERELLLLFSAGGGGLGGLRLSHALLEFVHAPGGVHEFLRASVEGMADVADADQDGRFGGAGLDDIAAGATDFRLHIFRMYFRSHKSNDAQSNRVPPIGKRLFAHLPRRSDELLTCPLFSLDCLRDGRRRTPLGRNP
jgi:hypothetical protein